MGTTAAFHLEVTALLGWLPDQGCKPSVGSR